MKTEDQIERVLKNLPIDTNRTKYPAMTYEAGIEEALMWVLEEIKNEEFEYANNIKE